MRLLSTQALGTSLAIVLAALVCATLDSRPAVGSPTRALGVTASAHGTLSAIAGRARIEVRFRKSTSGTFVIRGAIADSGSFRAARRVVKGRLQLTEVLAGRQGAIRIRASRPCAGGPGAWQVLSGSGVYEELSGRGKASGGPGCEPARYPLRAVYTGTVRTPEPPPIAQPGQYGGGTSDREEIVFEVAPGARTLVGLRLQRLRASCSPSTFVLVQTISFPGPSEIAQDGSFSLQARLASGLTQTVSGRLTAAAVATGTATVSHVFTDPVTKTTTTCSGTVSWNASSPPPSAPPGRYCGFTLQGPGICLDVAPNGREVTRFESRVVARCFPGGVAPSEIEITLTFSGSIPIGGHLGFSRSGLAVEGLVSGTAGIRGLFEPTGTASGTVSLGLAVLDHEGTRYQCHPAVGKWDARR